MIQLERTEPGTTVTDDEGYWGPFLVVANDGDRVILEDEDGERHVEHTADHDRAVTLVAA